MKRLFRQEDGFTGLEAAIVLIAFVVVAAVFSYVVLGAGFFTTQKSQEVVHTGVAQAASNMEILGDVYGIDWPAVTAVPPADIGDRITMVNFTLGLAAGGSPVDMTKVTLVYSNRTERDEIGQMTPLFYSAPTAGNWTIYSRVNADDDNLLEKGEQFRLSVNLVDGHAIWPNEWFNLEIRPEIGASLALKRNGPPAIYPVNVLY